MTPILFAFLTPLVLSGLLSGVAWKIDEKVKKQRREAAEIALKRMTTIALDAGLRSSELARQAQAEMNEVLDKLRRSA